MSTVIFNRETLKFSGIDRTAYPYEIVVSNVDVSGLTKQYPYTVKVDKLNEEGKQLYLLPQEDKVVDVVVSERYDETTEETEIPVSIKKTEKVPLLDDEGEQIEYEITELGETIEETEEPVMIQDVNEEGETIEVQKTNEYGEPLFYGQVGTGQFQKCYTLEEKEVHKTNDKGQKLYYKVVEYKDIITEPQEPIEITEDHEGYSQWLPKVMVDETRNRQVTFSEEPELFTYEDLLMSKREQVLKGTFFSEAILIERMDDELFSTQLASFNGDLGYDFVSIPAGGSVRTIKLQLPKSSDVVHVVTEVSAEGLDISVGDTVDTISPLDKDNEVKFTSVVDSVYVLFENPTEKRIDLHSFALLV